MHRVSPMNTSFYPSTLARNISSPMWDILISFVIPFVLIFKQQHRQIGNAVPVPLAMALGKALGDALLKMWQEEDRVGSPEV